jgi:hypothetical protein
MGHRDALGNTRLCNLTWFVYQPRPPQTLPNQQLTTNKPHPCVPLAPLTLRMPQPHTYQGFTSQKNLFKRACLPPARRYNECVGQRDDRTTSGTNGQQKKRLALDSASQLPTMKGRQISE